MPYFLFRINEYIMARDVRSSLKRQVTYDKQFLNHPLLIMNGFSSEEKEIQLTSSMFQNMFPSINVSKIKLNDIKRCVLLNRDEQTGDIEFRHYTIKVVPIGLSKGIKKIATGKIPNLARFNDMNEFLNSQAGSITSDSEGEEDESSKVTLPQGISARGNLPQEQSAIRLVELGPRMNLKLIKIEEGLFDGDVMYHSLVQKTDEERKAIRLAREKRKKEKEKRKKEQEVNVKKKERAKEDHKTKSLAGMQKKVSNMDDLPKGFEGERSRENGEVSDDDDEEWYRREVGKNPEKDLFDKGGDRKRKSSFKDNRFKKKRKFDSSNGSSAGKGNKKFPESTKFTGKGGRKEKRDFRKNSGASASAKGGKSKARFKVAMPKMHMKKKMKSRK